MARLALPLFLPLAVAWVRQRESAVLHQGQPLSTTQLADARALGVLDSERVRLQCVPIIATFEHPLLRPLAWATRSIFAQALGLTLGHAILIREDGWNNRELVAHELAHVAQYERFGGIVPFLKAYFHECVDPGYPLGPLEREAAGAAARLVAG